jgi:DNA-binding MarR family transcriptional regulator
VLWEVAMTGGRRPLGYDDGDDYPRPVRLDLPSEDEEATASLLRSFKLAMKFRRRANRALKSLGVSFAEWRTLEATWRLIRQSRDAVSHLDVAREMELDESSVSRVMHSLSRRRLVSHGPDAFGFAWRIVLSERGEGVVASAYETIAGLGR